MEVNATVTLSEILIEVIVFMCRVLIVFIRLRQFGI
jgi:hypothetical protein